MMKQWPFILTQDEVVALARAITEYSTMLVNKGSLDSDELQTLALLDRMEGKFPDEEWFEEALV